MLPVVELRGSLIYASAADVDYLPALAVSVLGNMIPVPFILLFFRFILKLFSEIKYIGPFLKKILFRAGKKAEKIGKYELLGLYLFVAIPLPGTGAWTGALVANILKLPIRKALVAILLGVCTSGLIMGALAYMLPDFFRTVFK
ncbi:hypothetical protein SDC9_74991 [bioreactor metagenome]|uniref:Small multi-drug export protein n=1 Tax=bioreactor metagenome TaxID=1076179 RepID=A0A644YIQ0_9ZZZZ